MDKIIFIPEPEALQLCAKEVTKVHSDVPLKEFCCMAVYAEGLSSKINKSLEDIQRESNAVLYGILPSSFPTDAVVGIAKLGKLLDYSAEGGYVYEVTDAFVLDQALVMSKKTARFLAETDLFFNLPRYSVLGLELSGMFDMLSFYVSHETFFSISQGTKLSLEIDNKVAEQILDEHGRLKKFNTICVHHGNMVRRFEWNEECHVETEMDDEGNPVCYPSREYPNEDQPRRTLHLLCTYKR